jgi:hypothetical protein
MVEVLLITEEILVASQQLLLVTVWLRVTLQYQSIAHLDCPYRYHYSSNMRMG